METGDTEGDVEVPTAGEPVADAMRPVLTVTGVPVGVETGDARGVPELAESTGEPGTTLLNGGAKPGHLPQVICI